MTTRSVVRVESAMPTSDGAGVRLFRALGTPRVPDLDPFLMLDEFRSDQPDDYLAGFPNHPHRGFETVTYMLAGRMEHKDSIGNTGDLGPGDVQWMTAGRGIVHSEFPRQDAGLMWGFQLWVNLPAKDKMTPPRYQDIPASRIPEVRTDAGVVRVLAGTYGGVTGPVEGVATRPTMLDADLADGASLVLPAPEGQNAFVYAFEGAPRLGEAGKPLPRGNLAILSPGDGIRVSGPGRVLLLSGTPLREPIARHGPFVMNTREQIVQAFDDFRAGRFGG
jgi:redox-sensitive bicupin YhaK (pirin superfamily)